MPVAVVFPIGLVVALGVADQVAQGKAIMRRDEVDAAVGATPARHKHIAGARQPAGHIAATAVAVQPKAALGVTVAVVPLQPARRKAPQLVAPRADVPGLGNHQAGPEHRVSGNGLQQGRMGLKSALHRVAATRQHRRQVKTKTIDAKFKHPAPQALQHSALHQRLLKVDTVTAAGPVGIAVARLRQQVVVQRVVDAAQRQRRAPFIELGRVVVDHV